MRRCNLSFSLLALVLVGLVLLGSRPSAVAQEGTPAAMAEHPVIGAWLLDPDADDPANPPSLAIFHDDGTYLEVDADGGSGIGTWEATGPTTAAATFLYHGQDERGGFAGTVKIRATAAVDAASNALTAEYTLEFIEPDGTSSGEMGPGSATAARIAVEPMGTPVGPLMPEEEGTPTS